MFNEDFIRKLKHFSIFIVIFTILFIIFFKTITYTIPFIIAFIIAICTKPLVNLIKRRFKLSSSLAALISTVIVFSVLVIILTTVIYKITDESKQLLTSLPDMSVIQSEVSKSVEKIQKYFSHINPSVVQKIQEQISGVLSSSLDITANILNTLVSYAVGLPMFFMLIVVTLLSTYFFTKDMPDVGSAITYIFADKFKPRIQAIMYEAIHMLGEYIKAYSIIITLSFLEILVGFYILKVKYALILSLLCWILELVPVLGIFIVFFPLIGLYFLAHNYFTAISLAILWVIVVAVRQIVEPKIVSSSLGLHPLSVLAAIFIGLTTYGFIGMIYILSALVFYKILDKVGII